MRSNSSMKDLLFPKSFPKWLRAMEVGVCCVLLISVAFAVVQCVFFMYHLGPWWQFWHGWMPEAECDLQVTFTYEVTCKTAFAGFILFTCTNVITLAVALRRKISWNTYLAWTMIHVLCFVVAFLGVFAWDGVFE